MPEPSTAFLQIPSRFNGPPQSGNGGWAAGALARHLPPGPVSVSLRAPVPLQTPLQVTAEAAARVLWHGPQRIAEAEPAWLDLELPAWPSVEAAEAASALARLARSRRGPESPFARCFACGYARDDGLSVVVGVVDEASGQVAAVWHPPADLDEGDGRVQPEAVWAALDCPAGIAWGFRLGDASGSTLTARITAQVDQRPRIGQRCRVVGWPIERDGRKLHAGSALLDDDGRVLALTRQLWLLPRESAS